MKRSRINPVNAERKERMRTDPKTGDKHTYGEYHQFVKTQRCCVTLKFGVDAHHLKSVKTGGRDYRNQVPLRHEYHIELHSIGRSKFERKYDIDLDEVAQKIGDLWDARRNGAPIRRWSCQCREPKGKYFCARCQQVIPKLEERDNGD